MEPNQITEQVKALLSPLAADQGAMVEGVDYRTGTNPAVLSVTVVREDATESLKVDQVADLARLFSKALDSSDPVSEPYTLEVTTPGAEGAIITETQWRRAVGKTVSVNRSNGNKIQGVLLEVGVDGIVLSLDNGREAIPFSEIKSARGVAELPKED